MGSGSQKLSKPSPCGQPGFLRWRAPERPVRPAGLTGGPALASAPGMANRRGMSTSTATRVATAASASPRRPGGARALAGRAGKAPQCRHDRKRRAAGADGVLAAAVRPGARRPVRPAARAGRRRSVPRGRASWSRWRARTGRARPRWSAASPATSRPAAGRDHAGRPAGARRPGGGAAARGRGGLAGPGAVRQPGHRREHAARPGAPPPLLSDIAACARRRPASCAPSASRWTTPRAASVPCPAGSASCWRWRGR